jgi:hypothetical protein
MGAFSRRRWSVSVTLYSASDQNPTSQLQQAIARCITGIAYEDDSQISELSIRRAYDKNRPRIELGNNMRRIKRMLGKHDDLQLSALMLINAWAGLLLFAVYSAAFHR